MRECAVIDRADASDGLQLLALGFGHDVGGESVHVAVNSP